MPVVPVFNSKPDFTAVQAEVLLMLTAPVAAAYQNMK